MCRWGTRDSEVSHLGKSVTPASVHEMGGWVGGCSVNGYSCEQNSSLACLPRFPAVSRGNTSCLCYPAPHLVPSFFFLGVASPTSVAPFCSPRYRTYCLFTPTYFLVLRIACVPFWSEKAQKRVSSTRGEAAGGAPGTDRGRGTRRGYRGAGVARVAGLVGFV